MLGRIKHDDPVKLAAVQAASQTFENIPQKNFALLKIRKVRAQSLVNIHTNVITVSACFQIPEEKACSAPNLKNPHGGVRLREKREFLVKLPEMLFLQRRRRPIPLFLV